MLKILFTVLKPLYNVKLWIKCLPVLCHYIILFYSIVLYAIVSFVLYLIICYITTISLQWTHHTRFSDFTDIWCELWETWPTVSWPFKERPLRVCECMSVCVSVGAFMRETCCVYSQVFPNVFAITGKSSLKSVTAMALWTTCKHVKYIVWCTGVPLTCHTMTQGLKRNNPKHTESLSRGKRVDLVMVDVNEICFVCLCLRVWGSKVNRIQIQDHFHRLLVDGMISCHFRM